jgi:hypothetical protein
MLTLLAAAALAAPSPIYHYIRSNLDGSEPEHVVHYRPSKRTISVYKWVEKCTTAAYVTADMDDEMRSGRVFFAGRVARNGTQKQFGRLTLDPQTLTLSADVAPPGGRRVEAKHALRATSFLLYDFDFADLNSFLQEHHPTFDFSYALPVIWPADASIFRDLGMLRAHFVGTEDHLGRATQRFDLRVEGPSPSTGTLWVDAKGWFIVEAQLGLPNHMEYKDFRLKLENVEPGGPAAWAALLTGHYANCPAPKATP